MAIGHVSHHFNRKTLYNFSKDLSRSLRLFSSNKGNATHYIFHFRIILCPLRDLVKVQILAQSVELRPITPVVTSSILVYQPKPYIYYSYGHQFVRRGTKRSFRHFGFYATLTSPDAPTMKAKAIYFSSKKIGYNSPTLKRSIGDGA